MPIVNVLVDSMAHFTIGPDLVANQPLLHTIRGALVFKNPEFEQAIRRRGFPPPGIDPEIRTYVYNRETGMLSVPRGFTDQLVKLLQGSNFEVHVLNRTVEFPHTTHYEFLSQYRPYQTPAMGALAKYQDGMLIAPCGSGKTTMGIGLIAQLRQPALWITHTKRLARQTEERAREILGLEEVGTIEDGKVDISPGLTIALIQTLVRQDLQALANRWGTVIYDEAHHIPAVSFSKVANSLAARYRYGLTANTQRSDGLYPVVLRLIGPVRHEITQAEVEKAGGTITPELIRVETGRKYRDRDEDDGDFDFANLMVKECARDGQRNELIALNVARAPVLARAPAGTRQLVLCQLVEHTEVLAEMLRDYYGLRAVAFHGKTKKPGEVDKDFRAGKIDVLVATLGLAKEGLDYPFLAAVHLAAPMRDPEGVKQAVGRVMRSHPGKTQALVFDYVDAGPDLLLNQAKERKKVYRKLGMVPQGGNRT